ncbi:unnamed protein product [Arabidopsis halleri]
MDEESNPMEDSCDEEFVCGDPKVDVRVGDEYQVEIPPMISESQRAALLLNPLDSDSSCSFAVGLPVEVMWTDTKCRNRDGLGIDDIDMNESLKSLKTKRSRRGGSDGNPGAKKCMNLEVVPEKSSSSWEDLEVDGFVLGLYTFGKNFAQVQKLLESKETGEILLFYYGKFYESAKYKIWSHSLKKRSRRCIQGKKLYSDWRLQLLLSRLIRSIPDELKEQKLVDVSKSFAEGKKSLEVYINAVKELVGLRCLVEAVAIGKDREDLTVLTTEPKNAKQWFAVSSAVPAGLGEYNSLTVEGIIEKLTGGSRLRKGRCNDIFWDAVWPRLLHRGWRSEQPKGRSYINSKDHIVFLAPGVKKFSRRKLVKHDHYFDSISDILKKVVSEPELLEETAEIRAPDGTIEENICNQSKQEKHCYLKSPNSSSTHMKFTVVDTSRLASRGKLCECRELRIPNPQSNACRGDNSSVERFQTMPLDVHKRAKFADERKWERRRKMKLVDEPMTFMIPDTSVEQDGHSSGIRRRRHFPGDENPCKIRKCIPKEAFGESSQNQSGTNKGVKGKHPKGTNSGLKEETLENVQQGQSKKIKQKFGRISESNNHHSVSFLPLPKHRRLSTCVRKDIKRSGESSVLKPPALHVDSMNLKNDQLEETENIEIQEKPDLMRNQEAACQHWRNFTLPGARAFPDPEELVFKEDYQKFARSSLETTALANCLIARYDRKLKLKLADRDAFKNLSTTFNQAVLNVEEMKKTIARLEREAETHQAEVGSLNDEIARLGSRGSDLEGEVIKLQADLIAAKDHEEKECSRLQNDRAAKAQARLDKVKAYMKEQEEVVQPKMDALSQSKGAQEIVAVLISRGAVISETELENLAKETKIADEEVDALEIMELTDTDLNMSPDQLGFRRVRSSTQATPVPNQHGSNSDLVSQSDIRHVTVDELNPEA